MAKVQNPGKWKEKENKEGQKIMFFFTFQFFFRSFFLSFSCLCTFFSSPAFEHFSCSKINVKILLETKIFHWCFQTSEENWCFLVCFNISIQLKSNFLWRTLWQKVWTSPNRDAISDIKLTKVQLKKKSGSHVTELYYIYKINL